MEILEKVLLIFIGLISGSAIHILKTKYDTYSAKGNRERSNNIDIANRIKNLILETDDIMSTIDLEKPNYKLQKKSFQKINEKKSAIFKLHRELTDNKLILLLDEYYVGLSLVEMMNFMGAVSFTDLATKSDCSLNDTPWQEGVHDDMTALYYGNFESVIRYINSGM